jgi:hypothetical protein
MTVMKAVVRGFALASLATASARGGSMLHLGVSLSDTLATPTVSIPAPAPTSPGLGSVGPALRLGVFAGAAEPAPAPEPAPTPVVQLPAPPPVVPVATPAPVQAPSSQPSPVYDALINFTSGPFLNASSLTTGSPQPWYLGAAVDRLFGGLPTIPQAVAFEGTVLQRVQQSFALSGVPVSLTLDPSAPAAHEISVVSQTQNPTLPSALGMTYLGGNGFQYIDTAASSASSVDQLEWIVAHNVAHELMLAFGVPEVHDQSGQFIDAPNASWNMMISPTATFSPGAVADLLSKNFQAAGASILGSSAQTLGPPTVPEPSAGLLWVSIVSAGLVVARVGRKRIRTAD